MLNITIICYTIIRKLNESITSQNQTEQKPRPKHPRTDDHDEKGMFPAFLCFLFCCCVAFKDCAGVKASF